MEKCPWTTFRYRSKKKGTLVGCPKKYDDPRFILAMDWLSDMLRNPMKKPGIMPYLYSHEHGAGKSKFFEFLSDFVIGDYYSTTMFLSNFEKFNSIIEKKLFIFISEANRSDQIKYETQIKSAITDGKTTIERKGYDSFMAVVSARIAMAANVESLIDAENRRNMLWEPVFNKSEEYITMYKELFESDRSKYYGAVFYTYLTEQHVITTKDFRFALEEGPDFSPRALFFTQEKNNKKMFPKQKARSMSNHLYFLLQHTITCT